MPFPRPKNQCDERGYSRIHAYSELGTVSEYANDLGSLVYSPSTTVTGSHSPLTMADRRAVEAYDRMVGLDYEALKVRRWTISHASRHVVSVTSRASDSSSRHCRLLLLLHSSSTESRLSKHSYTEVRSVPTHEGYCSSSVRLGLRLERLRARSTAFNTSCRLERDSAI